MSDTVIVCLGFFATLLGIIALALGGKFRAGGKHDNNGHSFEFDVGRDVSDIDKPKREYSKKAKK